MAKTQKSLKGSHILMWSSPLLLGVLVLTFSATSNPGGLSGSSSTSPVSVGTPTRHSPPTTSTEVKRAHTGTHPGIAATTTPVPVKTYQPVPTTRPARAGGSANSTGSTVSPLASPAGVRTLSGVVSGQLTPSFAFADVPLQGPGSWQFVASAATRSSLHCAAQTSEVSDLVVVGPGQTCQFEIQANGATTSINWQLTPRP